ncbi:MAG TPA: RsmB/NOP family class I SAM-dependent RNA methyltransferase [Caulobacteraceae bacterium]|nr:RsmB/NOP family class I SAM-dependent RNA methyltransferase [Caulobacteraceae bacterium]
MRDGGRIAAAIEVLKGIEQHHRPARLALKAWGDTSRYAGAKDRAWVSGLVLDALRHRRSLAWRAGADTPRAIAMAALVFGWGWSAGQVAEAFAEAPHGPGLLSDDERQALARPRSLENAPAPVRGDYPDWLDPHLERVFGEERADEAAALAARAPVDLRVNSLKAEAGRALNVLAPLGVQPAGILPQALRLSPPDPAARAAPVEAQPEHQRGWYEVQDLGSQIAAAAAGEVAGRQVLDLCAGGGGKTLALAAAMGNTGQLYAYDADVRPLSETVKRAQRAGVRNLQVRSPLRPDALADLERRMDVVFVDAPCSGSGTWRRHPDAKWRLRPGQLERRMAEQDAVLAETAAYVKPGGRMVYATCSVLAEENEDRVTGFLDAHADFTPVDALESVRASGLADEAGLEALAERRTPAGFLRLSPRSLGVDGFFIAVLERAR